MNYANIKNFDIANGPGLRVSLFVCGCTHNCKGCFNAELMHPLYGEEYTEEVENSILNMLSNKYISGLSLLGGDPLCFHNYEDLLPLVEATQCMNKTVWCYTGDTMEDILIELPSHPELYRFLQNVDVLVDGPFIEDLKDPSLKFKGSSNQRLIRCKDTLEMLKQGRELTEFPLWQSNV
jgi:anaerobic ribonucleoside-triphosphate reductase activating protein